MNWKPDEGFIRRFGLVAGGLMILAGIAVLVLWAIFSGPWWICPLLVLVCIFAAAWRK